MKVLKLALCAAAASLTMATAAAAQEEAAGPAVSFNVGVASDYVFRGVSQTNEDPQVFAGVDLVADIFYAGAWASNVDFGDETDGEFDLYAGVTPTIGPVAANFGIIYYGYIGADDALGYDYVEFKAAGSVPVGPVTLGAAAYLSPEFFGETGEAWYAEVNGAWAPMENLSISGAYGHQDVELAGDYDTWNLGATYAFLERLSFDVRYHDTNIDECEICDERVVATLKATFP